MEFLTFICACVFTLSDIAAQRKNPDRFKKSSAALDPNQKNAQNPKEPEKSEKPKTPVKLESKHFLVVFISLDQ